MRVVRTVQDQVRKIEFTISDDRLKLFARVEPKEECASATLEDLVAAVSSIAPAELLELDVIKDIAEELKAGKGCDARRVAQGRPSEPGRDGKLVWLVRRFTPGRGSSEEREFSDFFTLGLFENIEVGTEIARIYRPSGGVVGMDVQGKALPAKGGQAAKFRWDRSVELREDPAHPNYTSVVAAIAGYVHDEGSGASIKSTLVVSANLDWSMGHIDFIGNVSVGGDVQKGFNIKARGDIEVRGSVMGDNVLTSQGSITIRGFHLGDEDSSVTAARDYSASMAHGISASVGGDIHIEKEARDCSFRAGGAVVAPKAVITGGSIWCVKGVTAATIGNELGVSTDIELRNELEVTKEYRDLSLSIRRHEAALAALELHIGPYLKNRHRVPLLKNQFRIKITGLLDKYDGVVKSLSVLREKERVMRESKPPAEDARVVVSGVIHAGVSMTSGETRLDLKESVKGPISFRRLEHEREWVMEHPNGSSLKQIGKDDNTDVAKAKFKV